MLGDLISATGNGSDGQDRMGARCGGGTRRSRAPRRRARRRRPIRRSGGYLGWGLAVELYCGMGNPPRVRVGFGEVRSTKFGDHGGSGRRSSPVGVVWAVPVLGFGRKRAWEHAQDATRPRIRPVWPSAQRRGVRRGAAVLDCRHAGFGQKGCAMAYTSVQKGTRGRRRSSPRFGSKGRPARSARRRRSAAEEGRHSRSERCRASPGSWLHGWTRSVSPGGATRNTKGG